MKKARLVIAVGTSVSLALVMLMIRPSGASGQTGAGTLTGTVRDAEQKVVPAAAVTITNSETNISHKVQTSDVGNYYFGALPRGPYTLVVEKEGFKKWEAKFVLRVGENATVDPTLEVGTIRTVVEVTGAAPLITTASMEVSSVKDYERIRQLPLNGRSIGNLFPLTPGVEGGAGGARVNGMKVGSLEITLDGLSIVDRFGGGISRVSPGLDTVQEFRIETVGSDARYSRPANVTVATRSGTNEFHGSVFETHRNNSGGLRVRRRDDLGERDPVTGKLKFTPDQLIRNEYGGSAGGPFYIPGVYDGRNKTFWFTAFEGSRNLARSLNTDDENGQRVPTQAMWNGDFSNAMDTEGNQVLIYDPWTTCGTAGNPACALDPITGDPIITRQPFLNNQIPPDRISDTAKALAAVTARPNLSLNPYLGSNYRKFYPDKAKLWNLTIKGDHNFSDRDRLSVRWTRSTSNAAVEGGVYGNPVNTAAGVGTSRNDAIVHNVAANYNRTISPNVVNELLVGVHRSFKSSGTLADFTDWPAKLGLPNPFGVTGWPTFCAYNLGYYYGFCWDSDNRKDEALTGEVLDDNVTWVKGKHTIKFGGRLRLEQNNVRELQQAQGSHTFDGTWTALDDPADPQASLPFTGDGLADLLLGLPSYLSNQFNRGYFYFRQKEMGLYINDNWKVSPRLTLSLGLRWDNWTPYTEKFNRLTTADLNTLSDKFEVITPGDVRMEDLPGIPPTVLSSWTGRGLTWTTANSVGYPSNLFRSDHNNFGPRLGAAFMLTDKTVLRGGYGEYFWTVPLAQLLQASRSNPPLNLRYQNALTEKNFPENNYTLISQPAPADILPTATVDITGAGVISPSAQSEFIWDGRNWKDGRAQEWHVTLERQLPHQTALRLSYIGTHGSDLEQVFITNSREPLFNYVTRTGQAPPSNRDLLRVNPNWNPSAKNRTGFSDSHSAQIEIERKFSNGVAFQWFYTYNRSLTTTDAGGFTNGGAGINDSGLGGAVPENTQILGEPSLPYDQRLRLVHYNSTTIPPHRIRFNGVFDLPFGRGKKFGSNISGPLNQLIGGWQIATIGDWRGGFWQSVSTSRFQTGAPWLNADQRPLLTYSEERQRLWFRGDFNPSLATDVTGGDLTTLVPVDRSQRVVRPYGPDCGGSFNNNRLAVPLTSGGCFNANAGDFYNSSPRGSIIGPGAWLTDISVFKNFRIKERTNIRFTADFFNAFNHPNDNNPNSTTGLQNLCCQANDPRIIQFSLRVDW
jgi:hypothetical protein